MYVSMFACATSSPFCSRSRSASRRESDPDAREPPNRSHEEEEDDDGRGCACNGCSGCDDGVDEAAAPPSQSGGSDAWRRRCVRLGDGWRGAALLLLLLAADVAKVWAEDEVVEQRDGEAGYPPRLSMSMLLFAHVFLKGGGVGCERRRKEGGAGWEGGGGEGACGAR